MGKHFALSLQLQALNAQPRARHSSRQGSRFATAVQRKYGSLLFGACCLLGVVYLYQVNSFSTKGFEINTLQKQISTLQEQQRELQVQSAELQSLQRIQSQPQINSMVPVTTISYLKNSTFTQR